MNANTHSQLANFIWKIWSLRGNVGWGVVEGP